MFESQTFGLRFNYLTTLPGSPACGKQTVGLLGLYNNPEIINSVSVGVLTSTHSRRDVWVVQVRVTLLGPVRWRKESRDSRGLKLADGEV